MPKRNLFKEYPERFDKFVARLTLMNDAFFDLCMHDNIRGVQKIIQLILGLEDLEITSVVTQKDFPGIKRSLRLDVYAVDKKGTLYNIEIQVSNSGANPKRARFHASMLDVHHLDKGEDFDKLPESYVIFITMNDVLGRGQAVYTINRYIDGTNERFGDEQHIVYVNCAAEDDGSEAWKLIHDMTCVNPEEMLVPELAERVNYFKHAQKGERELDPLYMEIFGDVFEEERAKAEAEAEAKAEAKAAKAIAKAEAKLAKAEAKVEAKAEAKAAKKVADMVSKLIKAGVMTLESIAETLDMPLAEVQALAKKVKR